MNESFKENKEAVVEIRKANPEDFEAIRELHYQSWLATYPNKEIGITERDVHKRFEDRLSDKSRQWYEEFIKNPEVRYLVAVFDNKIIGFTVLKLEKERNFLDAIYLSPSSIGKGVGYKLWEDVMKYSNPKLPTELEVASYNDRAIEFYTKLGFEASDKSPARPPQMPISKITLPVKVMSRPADIK